MTAPTKGEAVAKCECAKPTYRWDHLLCSTCGTFIVESSPVPTQAATLDVEATLPLDLDAVRASFDKYEPNEASAIVERLLAEVKRLREEVTLIEASRDNLVTMTQRALRDTIARAEAAEKRAEVAEAERIQSEHGMGRRESSLQSQLATEITRATEAEALAEAATRFDFDGCEAYARKIGATWRAEDKLGFGRAYDTRDEAIAAARRLAKGE